MSRPLPVSPDYDEPALFARPEPRWSRAEHGYICEGCIWVYDRELLRLDNEGQLWLCPSCR